MRFNLLLISFLFFHSAFSQNSKKDTTSDNAYLFEAKFVDDSILPPGCGVIAYAVAKKFEIIKSNYPNRVEKYVKIIIQCPEFYGDSFLF